jgi:hypothetical protein
LRAGFLKKGFEIYAKSIISSFSDKGRQFIDSYIQEDNYIVVKKDEAYFRYKNSENHFVVSNGNITAWIKYDGFISIGDLHCSKVCSPDQLHADFRNLLIKLKLISFISGVPRIRMYVSPDCSFDRMLSRKYNSRESLHIGLLDFSGKIEIDKLKFTYADYDTF